MPTSNRKNIPETGVTIEQDALKRTIAELRGEYDHMCRKYQELNEKLEVAECENEYLKEYSKEQEAKCRHYEMLFTEAERNRQILAAQMDVVYRIFPQN